MSEQTNKYLARATESSNNEEGSNFEILKDVLKAVPSTELLIDAILAVKAIAYIEHETWDDTIKELQKQLEESERIYKKYEHILRK